MKAVSLFFDIGRGSFQKHGRTTEQYYLNFLSGIAEIDMDLFLFCDQETKDRLEVSLQESNPKKPVRISYILTQFSELPFGLEESRISDVLNGRQMRFYSLRDGLFGFRQHVFFLLNLFLKKIQRRTNSIWDILPLQEASAPEYVNWQYLVTTWAKPWALKSVYSKGLVPSDERLIFLDFGLGHSNPAFARKTVNSVLHDPNPNFGFVEIPFRGERLNRESPWDLAELVDDAVCPADVIVADSQSATFLANFFENQIWYWLGQGLALDDQVLLALYSSQMANQTLSLNPETVEFNGWYQLDKYLNRSS